MTDMKRNLLPYLLCDLEGDDLQTIIDVVTAYERKHSDCVSLLLVELRQRPSAAPLHDRRRRVPLSFPLTLEPN